MSLVLHARWDLGRSIVLWAEDAERPPTARPRRGPKPKRPRPRAHPFCATADELAKALDDRGVAMGSDAAAVTLTLVMPGDDDGPAPSPWLLRSTEASREASGLTRASELVGVSWTVPGLAVDLAAAVDLLPRLVESAGPGLAVGDSLRWSARVAEIAVEFVARGRVLPALVAVDGGRAYEARWRTIPGPDDIARLAALARSRPGLSGDCDLRTLVDGVADAVIRSEPVRRALTPPQRGRRPTAVHPAHAWIDALGSDDATVVGDLDELAKLAGLLDEWRRSAVTGQQRVRLCLRLDPPPAVDADDVPRRDGWQVEFLLQDTEDPSLLVSAAELWAGGPGARALAGAVDRPQECLLEGLGLATRLYPTLEEALEVAQPEALALDAEGATDFLRDIAPLLVQCGFGVLLPSWWTSGGSRLGARLRAKTKQPSRPGGAGGSGIGGVDALVDYRWEVAVGDHTLTEAELRELAAAKQPLVRMRGEWVVVRDDEIRAALELLERAADGSMRAGDVLRTALGLGPTGGAGGGEAGTPGLPVVGVEADGWLGELLAGGDDRRLTSKTTPPGFVGRLRPYQERGLAWLSFLGDIGMGACLADDMGLGKTAQLLALLVAERSTATGRRRRSVGPPTLVVCPMSLVGNWQREAARFAPMLATHAHHGARRLSGEAFADEVARHDLVITTYNLAARDRDLLAGVTWGRVVLDEAQNVKNSGTRQSQAVRSLSAHSRIALTGTPVENRLGELWSIMDFLNPGVLGTERVFRERFAVPIERYGDDEVAEVLRKVTGPFVLRRLKTDKTIISDLPEKLEMKVYCNLTKEQASLYQATVDDMLERIDRSDGIERRGLVLATMTKLKQVCNHPAQFLGDGSRLDGRSGKLDRVEEILEEAVAEGDRALVFTQYAEMGTMLHTHLQERLGREVLWLHGGTSKKARDEMVSRFQSDDGPPVFVLSIKAGGTGLNLTAANHVVHFDRWWNPAVEDQATDRAFRIGQHRNVQVRKLVCVGTLEERIDEMIERKRALAERIVGTGESWITELSTEALRQIVALSADAVAEV